MSSPSRKVLLSHPPHATGSIGRCAQCGNWAEINARTRERSMSTRVADFSPGTICRDLSDRFHLAKTISTRAETGKCLRNIRRKICLPVVGDLLWASRVATRSWYFRICQIGMGRRMPQELPSKDYPMNDEKKPWYQLRDSETKWYHHLMHGRVLIMLALMAIVALLALGVAILTLFAP